MTCHDGFTLNDLVSYSNKHNDANGENDRDGPSENYSANYGIEGTFDDPAVEVVRVRQIKNFLLTIAISRGVPMLLGGDEFRRSQRGNNNAYCQDNEISWVDWSLLQRNSEVFQFACGAFALRRAHPVLRREAFYTDEDICWFNPSAEEPGLVRSPPKVSGLPDSQPRRGRPVLDVQRRKRSSHLRRAAGAFPTFLASRRRHR